MKQAGTLIDLNLKPLSGLINLNTLAVASGKGGTGKTNIVVNLGLSLVKKGLKVAVLDADFGLGNIDILLGIETEFDIFDVLNGKLKLKDIIVRDGGLLIIPASSGIQSLSSLTESQEQKLQSELSELKREVDLLIIDTSAGISDNVMSLLLSSDEVLIVVSSEPTSIIDAYAVIKVLNELDKFKKVKVITNMVSSEKEAVEIFTKLSKATHSFLNKELEYQGYVSLDKNIVRSVKKQKPIIELFPDSKSCKDFRQLAESIKKDLNQSKQ